MSEENPNMCKKCSKPKQLSTFMEAIAALFTGFGLTSFEWKIRCKCDTILR